MTGSQLRALYLDFFKARDHRQIDPAPLVLENDPTTLFTSSGMQPLVPYLLGQPHPEGSRLVNSQPSFRSQDIAEIGDNRHTTFFEMLGNWSLGDYFKKEQLSWIYEFFTTVVKLDPGRLYVTVFAGNDSVPKDTESYQIWRSLGVAEDHLHYYNASKNWWSRSGEPEKMPAGEPGGPDSEIFFDFGAALKLHENSPYKDEPCHPNCDCARFLEIGNSVFMQYQKLEDGTLRELSQKNVDFGGGLERILAASQNTPDIFRTDLFAPIIDQLLPLTGRQYEGDSKPPIRVIADHLKASTFMIAHGVTPSNKQQGYILRRLLRRAAVKMYQLTGGHTLGQDFEKVARKVVDIYPEYLEASVVLPRLSLISGEMDKFARAIAKGLAAIDKADPAKINAQFAFDLYQTHGFPYEVTQEILQKKGINLINKEEYEQQVKKHQDLSRTTSRGMFKGGLADHSDITTKYHTATHLLHESLRRVLGRHVEQVGSNITADRLRFDFTHPDALTPDQLSQVESLLNDQISQGLPVSRQEMSISAAQSSGALAFFTNKYSDRVSVYSIGSFSKEVCGGPHVANTRDIGPLVIYKQESVGAGRRRLYARLK